VLNETAAIGPARWPSGPANTQRNASRAIRGVLLAMLVAALVIATTMAGQSTARLSYPFLDTGPLRPPVILYMPSYYPGGSHPLRLMFGPKGSGFDFEMRQVLASGGELIIWESTRYDATVEEAVGAYQDETELQGTAAVWAGARVANSGTKLLHARIGPTLVVISGELSTGELLRIADSLRRGSPQSLML
jgi:hypothetical protein